MKAFLGPHYHYSEKPVFKALWDNYNDCQFVEDTGEASLSHTVQMSMRALELSTITSVPII